MFAPAHVLTDADLFRRIVAFQRGLAMPLVDFWCAHTPGDGAALPLNAETTQQLVELLVAHGTPALFAMAKHATYCVPWRGRRKTKSLRTLSLARVADLALRADRVDILEWALETRSSELSSPRDAWKDAIESFTEDNGPHTLAVLKTYSPIPRGRLNSLISHASFNIVHVGLLRWLTQEIPDVRMHPNMVKFAADRGDLPMLQFLLEHGVRPSYPYMFILREVLDAHRLGVLAILLEHASAEEIAPVVIDLNQHTDPDVQQLALRFRDKLEAGGATLID